MILFPPPEKDGQIKFVAAKSLPYKTRMLLIAGLLLAGFVLQLTLGFWPGLALLAAGSVLGMVKGYDARPKVTSVEKWERVTPDEYTKIKLKAAELKKWDEDCFDITSTSGVLCFGGAVALCLFLYFMLAESFELPDGYWAYVGLDAAVVLFPNWFTGIRDYLRKDRLIIKIEILEAMMKTLSAPSEAQVFPMLSLADTAAGKKEPEDARLLVKVLGAPEAFYGMQVQVSINSVQGKDYPYLYCVLIGKSGSGLLEGYEEFVEKSPESFAESLLGILGLHPVAPKLVYEPSSPEDVDILVIRQEALQNTGYCTSPGVASGIVMSCFGMAQKLLKRNAPPPPPPIASPK